MVTEDELVEWPYRINGHESGQSLGDSEVQGSLVCCNPWGSQESDMTWLLNNNVTIYLTVLDLFL